METVLRALGISFPRLGEYDPELGMRRRGNITWRQRTEGGATVRINSKGYRDQERSLEKPPGTLRIAVLGDSQVEAWQVEIENRWTELLERHLRERSPALGVEVLNFGVSGYGTAEELIVLREDVLAYDPDIVLLGFLTGNDVQNNSEALQHDPRRPYFLLEDEKLVLDTSFRDVISKRSSPWRRLVQRAIDRSHVVQLAFGAKMQWDAHRQKALLDPTEDGKKIFLEEVGLLSGVYRDPEMEGRDPFEKERSAWRDAWAVTDALLGEMNREVRAHRAGKRAVVGGDGPPAPNDAHLVVVTLSNAAQVHPDAVLRRQFEEHLGVEDLFYPERRIRSVGAREGFPVVTLAETVQRHADDTKEFLHGFENTTLGRGHWNEAGHRLAAEIVGRALLEILSDGDAAGAPGASPPGNAAP
jgi:hypothetical protein